MKLGTYSTFDYPTGPANKGVAALDFLTEEFAKIGGKVRVISNPHDFGEYPSFEIDYPEELEFVDEDSDDEADKELVAKKDEWHDKADAIQGMYYRRFGDYL